MLMATSVKVPYGTTSEMNGVIDPSDQWFTGRPPHLPGTATVLLPPGVHGLGAFDMSDFSKTSKLLMSLAGAVGVGLWTTALFWAAGTKRKWTPGLVAGGAWAGLALVRFVWE